MWQECHPATLYLVICRDLYIKDVIAAFTFCPDFTLVGFHDRFRYAKTQAVAAVHGSCFIRPVEPLKDVLQILFGDRFAGAAHR